MRAFITDVGVISPAGAGLAAVRQALVSATRHLGPLTLFPVAEAHDHLVASVYGDGEAPPDVALPRTHRLTLAALDQLHLDAAPPLDWICLGTTTGGMDATEPLLAAGETDPARYRHHGLGTVAAAVRQRLGRRVPSLTFSTACSSGAVALIAGLSLIRSARARGVLVGGVESLCRLTACGFSLLQIVDPEGARPLDADRKGMTVGEGATLLLLQGAAEPPPGALAEVVGGGLSCDAHHPTAPDPDGAGAAAAMARALATAGLAPADIDYINLHGTGTPDNDAAEAKAVRRIFGAAPPPLSSTKGAFGHGLAASGALEAAIGVISLGDGLVPANVGLGQLDETLGVTPCVAPTSRPVSAVLSNSLGFGGNNASVVLTTPEGDRPPRPAPDARAAPAAPAAPVTSRLSVRASACLTGAGDTAETLARFLDGEPCSGCFPAAELGARFKGRAFRRWRRLPRLAAWVTGDVVDQLPVDAAAPGPALDGVYWATGWGAQTESHRFLSKLHASEGAFSSPIDFSTSVHNAPAGQLALSHGAQGPNVTVSAGTGSFAEAALAATLLADDGPQLLVAADEHHEGFTPLLQPGSADCPSDGAAALVIAPRVIASRAASAHATGDTSGPYLEVIPPTPGRDAGADPLADLLDVLGGAEAVRQRYGALWLGCPAKDAVAAAQREELVSGYAADLAVVGFRPRLGDFLTATGVAVVVALGALEQQHPLTSVSHGSTAARAGRPQLVVELGPTPWALEVGWP